MAKLIGHHFNGKGDGFSLFEVDGLKETPKQYTKTRETTNSIPKYSYEYWNIMPKSQLGELRKQGDGLFTMYAVQEDMPRFRALVIDSLTQTAERANKEHQNAARILNKATNKGDAILSMAYALEGLAINDQKESRPNGTQPEDAPQKYYDTIAVDFDGTLCEYRFPDIGKPKPLVIAFIKQHADRGTKIILHTCRENGTRRALLDEAVAWCAAHKIPLYAVNENPENTYPEQYGVTTAGRKVYADLYIDDKARNTADIEADMAVAMRLVGYDATAGAGQYADNPTIKQTLEYGV